MEGWYVVHTLPHGEELAHVNLVRQGFTAYLPRYRKQRRHARRVEIVTAPLFPRYLFVRLDPELCPWRAVNGTRGAKGLVSFGEMPARLPDGVVDEIKSREDQDGFVTLDTDPLALRPGQPVEIISGPLAERVAVVLGLDDAKQRVMVMLDLLGGQTKVSLPRAAVA